MASLYQSQSHKAVQGDDTGELKLKYSARQGSVDHDYHCTVSRMGNSSTSHTRESVIGGASENSLGASNRPVHLIEHAYSCFNCGPGAERPQNSMRTMDKLEIQNDPLELSITFEQSDGRSGWNGCCLFSKPERSYISSRNAMQKKVGSMSKRTSSKSSNLQLQCRPDCQSDGSGNVPVGLHRHLCDHSYSQTGLFSSGRGPKESNTVVSKDQEKSEGSGHDAAAVHKASVANGAVAITSSVMTSPKQTVEEVAQNNSSERNLDNNHTKLPSISKGTIQGDICVTDVLPTVATHLPDHLVDHSYQKIGDTSVVDQSDFPVSKGEMSDFQTPSQLDNVSSTSTRDKTIQISDETGGDVCGAATCATESNSVEKAQCGDDQPTKDKTVTVTLTFSTLVLGESFEQGQICQNSDVSKPVHWCVPLDHSYTGFCSTTVPCGSPVVEDDTELNTLNHDKGTSCQRIDRENECNSPLQELQHGVFTESNVFGIQHGSERKRPRKMASPHQYTPRIIDMESRLPAGTVDCLIFKYRDFSHSESYPWPRLPFVQTQVPRKKKDCRQLRPTHWVRAGDHSYAAAPQVGREKSVQVLEEVDARGGEMAEKWQRIGSNDIDVQSIDCEDGQQC